MDKTMEEDIKFILLNWLLQALTEIFLIITGVSFR